jgi:glycosyltransferase involved in cell wall biosynthesis
VRARTGINTDKVVGMVASFNKYKDQNTFITAAQKILSMRNNVSFLLIGDGENIQTCKMKVLPEFRDKIIFLGKIKKVEEIINIFNVGVLCSTNYGEGISNSIMEYMALKKPVIATDCEGNRELVVEGKTGFLVGQGNAKELAARIIQLLDNDSLTTQFGDAGHKRIVSEFNMEKFISKYIKLYKSILE